MLFCRRNDALGGDCPADVAVVRAQPGAQTPNFKRGLGFHPITMPP
jgi:hypothetical protein